MRGFRIGTLCAGVALLTAFHQASPASAQAPNVAHPPYDGSSWDRVEHALSDGREMLPDDVSVLLPPPVPPEGISGTGLVASHRTGALAAAAYRTGTVNRSSDTSTLWIDRSVPSGPLVVRAVVPFSVVVARGGTAHICLRIRHGAELVNQSCTSFGGFAGTSLSNWPQLETDAVIGTAGVRRFEVEVRATKDSTFEGASCALAEVAAITWGPD